MINVFHVLSRKRKDVEEEQTRILRESKEEEPVIYTCEDCGFVFYGAGEIRECPFCGEQRIRASAGEQAETLQLFLQQVTLDTFD